MTTVDLRKILWRGGYGFPGVRGAYESPYAPYVHALFRDSWNLARYGLDAPRFAERLWVNPRAVLRFDRKGLVWNSARVITGDWPVMNEQPIQLDRILRAAIAHWVDGKSWEESGELERMEGVIRRRPGHAGCSDRDDILERCARLDAIFRTVEREGRVRSMADLHPGNFRELDGIGMHIGPDGALIRAGNGRHRFAIAWILDLPVIPVRIGLVHHSALSIVPCLRHESDRSQGAAAEVMASLVRRSAIRRAAR